MARLGAATLGITLGLMGGCSSDKPSPAVEDTRERHVLVIGLDGVRADALAKANTPNLDALAASGMVSLTAQTQLSAKTKSGPGWASILTGVEAEKHRVLTNESSADWNHQYPTFLKRAMDSGKTAAVMAHWPTIFNLVEGDQLKAKWWGPDFLVVEKASESILNDGYDVYFLHLDSPDAAGHDSGFSVDNPAYIKAIEDSDAKLKTLLDAIGSRPNRANENWLILSTTDHGGVGTDHGGKDADNRTIYLIAGGDSAPKVPPANPSHMDIASTVVTFLGLEKPAADALDGHSLIKE